MFLWIYYLVFILVVIKLWQKFDHEWYGLYSILFFLTIELFFWLEYYMGIKISFIMHQLTIDFFSWIILRILFLFFLIKLLISFHFVYLKYSPDWWNYSAETIYCYFSYLVSKNIRYRNKKKLKLFYEYWFNLQYNKKKKFIYNVYVWIISLFFFFMFFIIVVLIFTSFFYIIYFDFIYYSFIIKLYIYNNYIFIIYYYFLLYLFFSLFFTNLKIRNFLFFNHYFDYYVCGIIDSYKISNSFIAQRKSSMKAHNIFDDPFYVSLSLLGMREYKKRYFKKKDYWFTLTNSIISRRIYLPYWWVTYENVILDEQINTFFSKFKVILFKIWSIIVGRSIISYIKNQKDYIEDLNVVEFSKLYENKLKNNFK